VKASTPGRRHTGALGEGNVVVHHVLGGTPDVARHLRRLAVSR
jgi:hypothetical protein